MLLLSQGGWEWVWALSSHLLLQPTTAPRKHALRVLDMTGLLDDGVEQDEHLIGILRAHGMRGTFNLNAGLYAPEGTVFRPGVISRRLLYGAGRSAPSLPSAFQP